MTDTVSLLEQHHRGAAFSDLMVQTTPSRFDAEFWAFWQAHLDPVIPAQPTLLDLGTGPGLALKAWAERYPQGRYLGVDLMPYMLDKARHLLAGISGVELFPADLHDPQVPLDPESVDVIQTVVVVHEMIQPIRLLQAAYGWLKPGGRLLLVDWIRAPIRVYFDTETEAQLFDPATPIDMLADRITHFCEHNRYGLDDLIWMLEHVGFRILAQQTYRQDRFARIVAEKAPDTK